MYPSGATDWSTQISEIWTVPPRLSITSTRTNVTLFWPAYAAGFQLQVSTNLAAANSWSAVAQTASTNSNQISVTIPTPAARQFFRLRQ
jgi:hypothetical protein